MTDPAPAHSEPGQAPRLAGAIFALIAIGAVLRFHGIGERALWIDEAYSANFAALPLEALLEKLGREATPPLYYLLLRVWTGLFGFGEAALRSFSASCSVAGLGVLATLAWRHASPRTAIPAVALVAFSPIHIYYAREARMYALLALLGSSLVLLACELVRSEPERSRVRLALAAIASLAIALTHNVGLWLVAAVNLAFLWRCRSPRQRLGWLASQGLAGLVFLPWLRILLEQVRTQGDVLAWFVPYWEAQSVANHFVASIAAMLVGPYPAYLAVGPGLGAGSWIAVGAVWLALFGTWRARQEPDRSSLAVVATSFAIAMVLSLGYSLLSQPVHIAGRTDQALLPLFALLLAVGASRLPARGLGWIFVAAIVALQIARIPELRGDAGEGAKDGSRAWLEVLEAGVSEGDAIITTDLSHSEVEYGVARGRIAAAEIHTFPRDAATAPGYVNYQELRRAPEVLETDARWLTDECGDRVRSGRSCFVVLAPPEDVHGRLERRLRAAIGSPTDLGDDFELALVGTELRVLRFGAPERASH